MRFLKIVFKGWTSTPRDNTARVGTTNCLMTPTYSMLIGLIECCVGKRLELEGLKIGFHYKNQEPFIDMETTHRFELSAKRQIIPNKKGTSITNRTSHTYPELTLFINRLDYKKYFEKPVGIPCIGRSQDLVWIENISEIEGEFSNEGEVNSGMFFMDDYFGAGEIIRCADAFIDNEGVGNGRSPYRLRTFISSSITQSVKSNKNNIFHSESLDKDVYIYEF